VLQEGQTGVIELPSEDDPIAVRALVEFYYTGSYKRPLDLPELFDGDGELFFHLAVYEIADRFQQLKMKALAEQKFADLAHEQWDSAIFVESIRKAYNVAPPGTPGDPIRNTVVAIAANRAQAMSEKESFRQVLREVIDFCADLNVALCERLRVREDIDAIQARYECPGCDSKFCLEVPDGQRDLSCPVCTSSRSLKYWRSYAY
jgi:DNA-directed RNA polymerase subunit RPC12/RpoP